MPRKATEKLPSGRQQCRGRDIDCAPTTTPIQEVEATFLVGFLTWLSLDLSPGSVSKIGYQSEPIHRLQRMALGARPGGPFWP
jgi:hypothetical protein